MVAQSLNFSCGFCFLSLIMTKFVHILSACDGQLSSLIARNGARILQHFLIVMFSSMLAILSHFLPSSFLAPGIAFWAFERTRIVLFKLIFYKDYMQTQRVRITYCESVLTMWKTKLDLMVVIRIRYVLNRAIKTEGWGEKTYFLTSAICSVEVVYAHLIASERGWPVQM